MKRARLCALSLFALASPAAASPQDDALLPMPVAPLASQGQASAITRNPALLGEIGSWELDLQGYFGRREPRLGTVFSAFAGLRPARGFALAMGLSRRTETLRQFQGRDTLILPRSQLSFGLSLGDPSQLAVGLALHTSYQRGEKLRSPDLQAGILTRLGPYLSYGSSLRHRPRYFEDFDRSYRSHTRWSNELAVRALGTPWLELAGSSHLWTRRSVSDVGDLVRSSWMWGGRISALYQGVGLDFSLRQRILDDESNLQAQRTHPLYAPQEWQWGVALRLQGDMSQWTLSSRGQSSKAEAFALGLRLGQGLGGPDRKLLARSRRVVALDLSEIHSEHDMVEMLEALRVEREGNRQPILIQGSLDALGWANAMELRSALCRYRDAGGRIFAHLDSVNLRDYYIATVAESIFASPTATFALYEPGRQALYFRKMLERASIRAQWLHTGPYKSLYERYGQDGPSEMDQAQRGRIYALIEAEAIRAISGRFAKNRTKTPSPEQWRSEFSQIEKIFGLSPMAAPMAQSQALIDKVAYLDESEDAIAKLLGASSIWLSDLESDQDWEGRAQPWGQSAYLGVVVVQGSIVSGSGFDIPIVNNRFSGDQSFADALELLRDDPNCYGVIVRVNSPGGSAEASDRMWKAVHDFVEGESKTPRGGKKLVISMSDAAASGGYYLAAGAEHIFAQPLTVTGSIGVTALQWDLSALLTRLGISRHYLGQGKAASPTSPFAPWTPSQRKNLERNIEASYDLFLSKVEKGRKLPKSRVRELAGGRVWMGYDAKPRKLVDEWGGLEAARNWLFEQLPAAKQRQAIGLRVIRPEQSLLNVQLSALGTRISRWTQPASTRAASSLLSALMKKLADDPVAQLLLDLAVLPQSGSLSWSSEAASATASAHASK